MAFNTDNSIMINKEHAYAVPDDTFQDSLIMQIKTEEITIKAEPPDYYEYSDNVDCDNSYEAVEIKKEPDPLALNNGVPETNGNIHSDKYMLIEKEALNHLKKELLKKNNEIKQLTNMNTLQERENVCLKQKIKNVSKPLQKTVDLLKAKNNMCRRDLLEYERIKKSYKLLEEQLGILTRKMNHFMNKSLSEMFLGYDNSLGHLQNQIKVKDKHVEYIGVRVENLMTSLDSLKNTFVEVSHTSKTNLVKATSRSNDLEARLKAVMENNEMLRSKCKVFEEGLYKRQNELKMQRQNYKILKGKFKHSLIQREIDNKQICKLKRRIHVTDLGIVENMQERKRMIEKIDKLTNEVKEQKSCEYCGL